MAYRTRLGTALMAALALVAAVPVASIQAADHTAVGVNLLKNSSYEYLLDDGSLKTWSASGDDKVEAYGSHAWPSVAYGNSYHAGKRYFTCGKQAARVTQTVPLSNIGSIGYKVKAKLQTDFGGTKGNIIRVTLRVSSPTKPSSQHKEKVLDTSNHFKVAVTSIQIPTNATAVTATIDLKPKPGASCTILSDLVKLQLLAS